MEIILNIDVWKDGEGKIFTKPQLGEGFVHIPAGQKIEHNQDGLFVRRIADLKIIFSGADLPTLDQGPAWGWKGFGKPDRPELQGA
jgi:hypothetical protein